MSNVRYDLMEHEVDILLNALRFAMRQHQQMAHGNVDPEYYGYIARQEHDLLELLNPKHHE